MPVTEPVALDDARDRVAFLESVVQERDATIATTVRDLTSWSIGADEITVSFDPYAVGAYAEGAYSCSFPTKGVKELALPKALLP